MSDRFYRIATMGVMDLLRVEIDMYGIEGGHMTHIASTEVYVQHDQADGDFQDDLRAIAGAIAKVAGA